MVAEGADRLDQIKAEIGALVSEFADVTAALTGVSAPFVTGWGLSYEYQSIEDHAAGVVGRSVIVPEGQMVSASVGLGVFLQQSFQPVVLNDNR